MNSGISTQNIQKELTKFVSTILQVLVSSPFICTGGPNSNIFSVIYAYGTIISHTVQDQWNIYFPMPFK